MRVDIDICIYLRVDKEILQFFGHIMRRNGDNLKKLSKEKLLEGYDDVSPKRWIDQICDINRLSLILLSGRQKP